MNNDPSRGSGQQQQPKQQNQNDQQQQQKGTAGKQPNEMPNTGRKDKIDDNGNSVADGRMGDKKSPDTQR